MPDDRAEINRGIAEAVYNEIAKARTPYSYYGEYEIEVCGVMLHIDTTDYCSSLDAGVEACGVLGLYPQIRQGPNDWTAMIGRRHDCEFGEGVMWDDSGITADTPALALARAVLEAVK